MGKIAGVSVQKGEGNFGASFRMNVRSGAGLAGTGQPVYYVDGIKVENSNWRGAGSGSGHYGGGGTGTTSLIHLDPNDIESIEVNLDTEVIKEINAVHYSNPNPAP